MPVTAVGFDPDAAPGVSGSGLIACDLYVSTNDGPFVYWTTVHPWAPTADFVEQTNTTYGFISVGHDAAGNIETMPTTAQAVVSSPDTTAPVTHVTAVDSTTATFVVSYTATDTGGSGLATVTIFAQVDGGPAQAFAQVTASSGTVSYQAIVDGNAHTYRFYSQGADNAGNVQSSPSSPTSDVVVTATFGTSVPLSDTTPPVTDVTGVDSSTPAFVVSYTATDSGGSGLAHVTIFVSVDGGAAQQVAQVTASSGTVSYQAIVDGAAHTYRFFSEGIDNAGNVQPTPSSPASDVFFTTTFSPSIPVQPTVPIVPATPPAVPLAATGFVVQHGETERSYIRYVDLMFNESASLDSLISGNEIHLVKHNLNGGGSTPVSLTGLLHVVDQAIEIDFGALGLGGNPGSTRGDGYYEITIDGSSQPFFFHRLLGDVNGDGVVNKSDMSLIKATLGRTGSGLGTDVNGDGVVTKSDLSLAKHSLGRKLALSHHRPTVNKPGIKEKVTVRHGEKVVGARR